MRTVFERLEKLKELEIQYSQALERSIYIQSDSHRINCLRSSVSLSLQSALKKHKFYHNFRIYVQRRAENRTISE